MIRSKCILSLTHLLLAASLTWLAGCTSRGYEKGDKTAANLQATANDINALQGKIDATLASLKDIVEKPQADLRPQYKQFVSNLGDLESSAKDIGAARKAMAKKGKAFFTAWDEQLAQIKNEDIKTRSQSRKEEVMQKLTKLKVSYTEAETAFKPFLSDLKDVEKFLGTDLTAGGVSAIKDTAAKANKEAGPLKTAIGKLSEDFKALGLSMSSVTPQQQTPAATK